MKTHTLGVARFTISQEPEGEVLTIPAPRYPSLKALIAVWLVCWTLAGLGIAAASFYNDWAFSWGGLAFWAIGWTYSTASLGWMVKGKEELRVRNCNLKVTRHLLGYVQGQTYLVKEVTGIAAEDPAPVSILGPKFLPGIWSYRDGVITFSYQNRLPRLAPGLDRRDAEQVVAWIRRQMDLNCDDGMAGASA